MTLPDEWTTFYIPSSMEYQNFSNLNAPATFLGRLLDPGIVGICVIQSNFEFSNFNITPPNGNIGSPGTSFLDFVYL